MVKKKRREKKKIIKKVEENNLNLNTNTHEVQLNSNRNQQAKDVLIRYQSNENYRKELNGMYQHAYQNQDGKQIIDQLIKELAYYAGTTTPDYTGYKRFIYDNYVSKLPNNTQSFLAYSFSNPDEGYSTNRSHYQNEINVLYHLPFVLGYLDTKRVSQTSDDKSYNMTKLLYSLFSTELSYVLDIVMNSIDNIDIEYLDDDLNLLNNRGLIHRLFTALKRKEKYICFKILGRAQSLDPGELEYLEAVVHFYDENYDHAIRYASKVTKEHADYGKAIGLLLECYGVQGDYISLEQCITSNPDVNLQPLQLLYAYQEIVLHSKELPKDDFLKKIKIYLGQSSKTYDSKSEYYDRIIKNVAESIYTIYTLFYNKNHYPNYIENQNDDFIKKAYASLSCSYFLVHQTPLEKQLKLVDHKILEGINNEIIDDQWLEEFRVDICILVTNLCVQDEHTYFVELLVYALEYQYRLGMITSFLDNVVNHIQLLKQNYYETKNEFIVNILLLAYNEQAIRGLLSKELQSFVEDDLAMKIDESSIIQKQVTNKLSKNGYIALESAETLFTLSKSIDWGWKDAGMISLAYFRIIEVEINQKVLLPILNMIPMDQLKEEYLVVRNSLLGTERQIFTNKWSRLLSSFEKIKNNQGELEGLMLGEMEYFFSNLGSTYFEDDILSKTIQSCIVSLLQPEANVHAFIKYLEEQVVDKDTRSKYRNPPAHTKYLPYDTACQCREYFFDVMVTIQSFLL